jgi:hypothetical protein
MPSEGRFVTTTKPTRLADTIDGRRVHRKTCILAGGLALLGVSLALFVHPLYSALAVAAGFWLILVPESKVCVEQHT